MKKTTRELTIFRLIALNEKIKKTGGKIIHFTFDIDDKFCHIEQRGEADKPILILKNVRGQTLSLSYQFVDEAVIISKVTAHKEVEKIEYFIPLLEQVVMAAFNNGKNHVRTKTVKQGAERVLFRTLEKMGGKVDMSDGYTKLSLLKKDWPVESYPLDVLTNDHAWFVPMLVDANEIIVDEVTHAQEAYYTLDIASFSYQAGVSHWVVKFERDNKGRYQLFSLTNMSGDTIIFNLAYSNHNTVQLHFERGEWASLDDVDALSSLVMQILLECLANGMRKIEGVFAKVEMCNRFLSVLEDHDFELMEQGVSIKVRLDLTA